MSIKVVCGCGFCTLLPSDWEGKRVKCKCGRTFVVRQSEEVAGAMLPTAPSEPVPPPLPEVPPASVAPSPPPTPEPPDVLAGTLVPPESIPPESIPREPIPQAPIPLAPIPLAESPPAAASTTTPRTVRHPRRPKSKPRSAGPLLVAILLLVLAGLSITGLTLVLREHEWSLAGLMGRVASRAGAETTDPKPGEKDSDLDTSAAGKSPESLEGAKDAGKTASEAAHLANLTPLVAEDGLLLSGLFGDDYLQLNLSAQQSEALTPLVARLKANEQALKDKSAALEQWYAESRKVGDELLALLNDDQKRQMQILREQGKLVQPHLVDYSARILPELAVAQMPWSAPTEGRSFHPIAQCPLAVTDMVRTSLAREPIGLLATMAKAGSDDAVRKVSVWDLATGSALGAFEVASIPNSSVTMLSRDGKHWLHVHGKDNGPRTVDVWSVADGKRLSGQEIPQVGGQGCTVLDCTGSRVVGTSPRGYWIWDFEAAESRVTEFPPSQPDIATGAAVSAAGNYLVVAHGYGASASPEPAGFLEVSIYKTDSGEMVGNQVLMKDYRQGTISAMAFSPDGRELALLWDLAPPEPLRQLVYMNATNGKVIKVVEGLLPAAEGFAHKQPWLDRDLIWLDENAGWIVNLQQVVDAETGAVLDITPPGAGEGATPSEVVEVAPTGDGRVLWVLTDKAVDANQPRSLRAQFTDLPRLGPFQ